MSETPSYERETRQGPLPVSTKFYQGIGAIPDTLKNWVFNTFVLLFYNQILGMDAFLVSIALAVAMVFDAVTDPVVGSFSDNLRTRWGRRHPLMFIASIPLGLCVIAVFIPPDGLSHIMLFVWLTTFTVLTRGFMTLYFVPWSAIAAELSDDYNERTSIMMFRFAVGWTFGVGVPFVMLSTVMANTEAFPVGQLNPYAYPAMATWTALIMICGALATTFLTRREIPYLRQHVSATPPFRFGEALGDMIRALKNRQFALVFTIVFISSDAALNRSISRSKRRLCCRLLVSRCTAFVRTQASTSGTAEPSGTGRPARSASHFRARTCRSPSPCLFSAGRTATHGAGRTKRSRSRRDDGMSCSFRAGRISLGH